MTRIQLSRVGVWLAAILLVAAPCAHAISITDVWINEFHYDNQGGDSGEFIEIAGLAGTDLSSFAVSLYNGSNGTYYQRHSLSGTLADSGNGYGFFTLNLSGFQNGSPDGFSLFSSILGLVEFFSYEGSFTAVGGDANGVESTEIEPAESGNDPTSSIHRTGYGLTGSEFEWELTTQPSAGSQNAGQNFGPKPVPDIAQFPLLGSALPLFLLLGAWSRKRKSR